MPNAYTDLVFAFCSTALYTLKISLSICIPLIYMYYIYSTKAGVKECQIWDF